MALGLVAYLVSRYKCFNRLSPFLFGVNIPLFI